MTEWEERMRRALFAAAAQFSQYAEYHQAKNTPDGEDKAGINIQMMNRCYDAATPPPLRGDE